MNHLNEETRAKSSLVKRVLITGGSRGLGLALAEVFGRMGARVALVARTEGPLEQAVAQLRAQQIDAHGILGDSACKEHIHRVVGLAQASVGPIDTVVHNASVLGPVPMPLLGDLACEAFEATLQANLLGPFRLTKAMLGSLSLQASARIAFISSDAAVSAYPTWGAYGVSKAAADHLMRVFAAEHPQLSFFSFDPGEMDTTMHAAALPNADRSRLARPSDIATWIACNMHCEAGTRLVYPGEPEGSAALPAASVEVGAT
jgi:NAD(P)-dependent dehydrogenase (short-subunit alcohol dehydrogenase family)